MLELGFCRRAFTVPAGSEMRTFRGMFQVSSLAPEPSPDEYDRSSKREFSDVGSSHPVRLECKSARMNWCLIFSN